MKLLAVQWTPRKFLNRLSVVSFATAADLSTPYIAARRTTAREVFVLLNAANLSLWFQRRRLVLRLE